MLILLLCSTITKKIGKRRRPDNPREENPQPKNCRWVDLRGHETNKSMPSGDAAQAALACAYLAIVFPNFYLMMGSAQFAWKFVAMVSAARVFYHCHFWGDTIVGVAIGFSVGHACAAVNLGEIVAMPIAKLMASSI